MKSEETPSRRKTNKILLILLIVILTLISLMGINRIIVDERNKMKYPGIVQDELFYKYFTKVDKSSSNGPFGEMKSETYIFNIKALYDDLGYTQKINELNEKYRDRGINFVIPESDHKYYASESITFSSVPEMAQSALYREIFDGTFLYDEKIVDPDKLMNLSSIQNSSIKSIMLGSGLDDSSSTSERLQKFAKDGQKIRTVDDIINKVDYKKAVHEPLVNLYLFASTKKTEKSFIEDSSNKDLDSNSYKNNPEYVRTQEAIQKELDEKYSSITSKRTAYIFSPKSETPTKTYDYSDPNYEGI
jgi:hypothetical protein